MRSTKIWLRHLRSALIDEYRKQNKGSAGTIPRAIGEKDPDYAQSRKNVPAANITSTPIIQLGTWKQDISTILLH